MHIDRLLRIPDVEIVQRIRDGDGGVYEALARAYVQPLYLWGAHYFDNAHDARDAVSEVLVQVWLRRKELHVKTTLEAYLFGAVRQRAFKSNLDSRRRAELLNEQLSMGEIPAMSAPTADPGERASNADMHDRLRAAIDALPDHFRAVLQLKLERDMTYEEIASVLGITPANTKKIASRAIQLLRSQFPPDSPLARDFHS